uniref:Galectin domain-containing protein n=1 Tax=Globodera rostochiensis TaxID=31243 RepID=A0A914HTB2_GLORO
MAPNRRRKQSQSRCLKRTRLTGQSTDEYVIPFALLDQCFPYEESKTFGLEFRLPEIGGRCDKGMLICYPSTLITHPLDNKHIVNGMSVNSELFNVDSAAKNSLAKECKELLARISIKKYKDREFWHGIQVYTVKKSDGTIAMKLNTSLSDGHSFEIPQAQRQFIIHLGNEREFVTYVRIDKGEPVEVEGEKAKREAYKQLAPRGAHLKDFVGFWTLGLDMLPWMNHTMRLHVQRDCDCFMEAWFIRPTDSEPADIKELTRGSAETECSKEEKTNLTVSLKNNPLKPDHLIHIRLMASKFTRNVTFKLYTSGWKAHIALMSFVISCKRGFVFMRSARERHVNGGYFRDALDCGRNQSTTHQLEFRIALTKYSYGIMFGRFVNNEFRLTRLSEEEFFPPKWWQGLPFENMDYYRLSGEFMLLNDPPPPVMPFKKIGENYRPKMQTDHFNTFPIDNLIEGTLLTFRVKPHNPKDYTFNITLLHDRPEEHPTIGKTVLKIQVYPNKLRLSPNFVEDKEINDRFKDVPHDIERDLLEVNITVVSDRNYMFIINGELVNNAELNSSYSVLPIWATNNVRIDGNISQLGPPRINMPPFRQSPGGNNRRAFTKFTKELYTLLNYNDIITIDMEIFNTSKFFAICLMDESLEPDPNRIGHIVLALPFTVNETTLTQCQYHLHQDELKPNGNVVDNRLNVNGQRFNMTIKCAKEHFVINLNEVDFGELKCSYPTTKDNITMPPWSVDHIQIRGDLFVHTLEVTHPEESTPEFFMGVDHNEAVLKPGDVINVKINKTSDELTVNLFYDALQFNEKVGKTVMSIKFDKNQNGLLYFDSYDNGPKSRQLCYNNNLNLTLASQELDFKIEAIYNETTKTEGFNVTLNDVYMCAYMDGLPPWAVHYITIESTNVELGSATNITCKPKKRCRPRNRTDIYQNDKFYDLITAIGEHFGGEFNVIEKALALDLNSANAFLDGLHTFTARKIVRKNANGQFECIIDKSALSIFDYWIEIIEMKAKTNQKTPIFGVAIYKEKYNKSKNGYSKKKAFKLSRQNYEILKEKLHQI